MLVYIPALAASGSVAVHLTPGTYTRREVDVRGPRKPHMPDSQKTRWVRAVIAVLDGQEQRVFGPRELTTLLEDQLAPDVVHISQSPAAKLKTLISAGTLRPIDLYHADRGTPRSGTPAQTKYAWRHATQFDVALSLRPQSYISHLSATEIHGLSPRTRTVYVNKEQSPKPRLNSVLSQIGIDRAFSGKPRQTTYVLTDGKYRYVLLNGKNTADEGVIRLVQRKRPLRLTNVERTLIDMVVRPQYAGGAGQILRSTRAARERVRTADLIRILLRLDHAYPYHQALGFYLEAAGFSEDETKGFFELGVKFNFYLEQSSAPTAFNEKWRIHYPTELVPMLSV